MTAARRKSMAARLRTGLAARPQLLPDRLAAGWRCGYRALGG
jgi:hypothetical protein